MEIKSFISGLVCGSGVFYRYQHKHPDNFIEFRFRIERHIRDNELLELLRNDLGCGKVKIYPSRITIARFEVIKLKDNIEKVIPYFKDILLGHKKILFDKWSEEITDYYNSKLIKRIYLDKPAD